MLTHVLFDVDGVLIDSTEMYRATWGAWAELRGVDPEVMFDGIHGERGVDTVTRVAPWLVADDELVVLAELLSGHENMAAPYVGAAEVLSRYQHRCALVTSAPRLGTLARFKRLALPIPDVVVAGEDVSRGKPDPEPFLLGSQLLGVPPAECVVIEDAPAGIAAGKAAGCYVLGVRTGAPIDATLADEIVDDLISASQRLDVLLK